MSTSKKWNPILRSDVQCGTHNQDSIRRGLDSDCMACVVLFHRSPELQDWRNDANPGENWNDAHARFQLRMWTELFFS